MYPRTLDKLYSLGRIWQSQHWGFKPQPTIEVKTTSLPQDGFALTNTTLPESCHIIRNHSCVVVVVVVGRPEQYLQELEVSMLIPDSTLFEQGVTWDKYGNFQALHDDDLYWWHEVGMHDWLSRSVNQCDSLSMMIMPSLTFILIDTHTYQHNIHTHMTASQPTHPYLPINP